MFSWMLGHHVVVPKGVAAGLWFCNSHQRSEDLRKHDFLAGNAKNKCLDGSDQIEPLNDEGDCGKSSSADQGKVFNFKTLQLKKFMRPI